MTFYDDLVRRGQDDTARLVDVDLGADRAVVTLNHPDRLNVLSAPRVHQLKTAPTQLSGRRALDAPPGHCAGAGPRGGG